MEDYHTASQRLALFVEIPRVVLPNIIFQSFPNIEADMYLQAFEGEYPKLVRLYHDLWSRLRLTAMQVTGSRNTSVGLQELGKKNGEVDFGNHIC